MKSLIKFLAVPAFFLIMPGCDHENNPVFNVDCGQLVAGIINYNPILIKTEIEKLNQDLNASPSGSDDIGQGNNLDILIARLNRCDEIMAEELCYACIKTYPAQSEILVTVDSSGTFVKRILDIRTPEDTLLQFAAIHEAYPEENILLQKTEYLGCFGNEISGSRKSVSEFSDTVFYSYSEDTLKLSVILNYNCCGALTDSISIKGSNVDIYVTDTCTADCLCKCMCNFELDYYFSPFAETEGAFNVYLKGLNESEFSLWKKTYYKL